jgi:hypothetical protein
MQIQTLAWDTTATLSFCGFTMVEAIATVASSVPKSISFCSPLHKEGNLIYRHNSRLDLVSWSTLVDYFTYDFVDGL